MPFQSVCASDSLHNQWSISSAAGLSQLIPRAIRDKLLQLSNKTMTKHYSKKDPKFCRACVIKVQELFPELIHPKRQIDSPQSPLQPKVTRTEALPTPEGAKKNWDLEKLTESERNELAYQLGKLEANRVRQCARSSVSKDVNSLSSVEVDTERKTVELKATYAFLSGLTGEDNTFTPYQFHKAIEAIQHLTAHNLNLPLHFRESIIIYALTGSKLALSILGSGGAHTSYKAVKSWLSGLGTELSEVPDGDALIAFDNNQILQRRWKVKLKNEVKCNIVTMVAIFTLSTTKLQHELHFKPSEWSLRRMSEEQITTIKLIDQDKDLKESHYSHLHEYLQEEIKAVVDEHIADKSSDIIDKHVQDHRREALYKKCYNCNYADVPKKKRLCPMCKADITKSKLKSMGLNENGDAVIEEEAKTCLQDFRIHINESSSSRSSYTLAYERQSEEPRERQACDESSIKPECVLVREPIYMNPCSYEAVCIVLRNIGRKAGVKQYGGDRDWVFVVCDGIPFTLCQRIIKSAHVCLRCDSSFYGLEACELHNNENHPGEAILLNKEFDWVLMQPGNGHIEMNMVKGIFELGWDVVMKTLAICMNFRSEGALYHCKKVSDHHKGWTLCRIARQALTRELLVPFVREELLKSDPDTSVAAFMKFIMNAQDPNYTFIADYTLELLDGIFLFRDGVRSGNTTKVRAGRAKYAKVWSGRCHPLYRELEAADSLLQLRLPDELKDLTLRSGSLSLSGEPLTGEGADFRLEEINRQVQQWLPNIPSPNDWKIACCNYDKLTKLRSGLFEQMGVKDPKDHRSTSKAVQDIHEEVVAFRTKLRLAEYLLTPQVIKPHLSLEGDPLDPDLKHFCQLAREKRSKYVECYINYEATAELFKPKPPQFKEYPVFITDKERQKYTSVENQTVAEIKRMVEDEIQGMNESAVREALLSSWNEIKKSKKSVLLDFYRELEEYASQDVIQASDSEAET